MQENLEKYIKVYYPNTKAFRPVSDKYLVDLLLGTDFAYTGDD